MTAHSPLRCSNSAMVQRGANEVVLLDTGSYPGFSNYLNETWTWNGTDWTNQSSTLIDGYGPLPTRINMIMSYDGYNVMMYGGEGQGSVDGALEDTWLWNGTLPWTKKVIVPTPTTVPFGRYFAEACRSTLTAITVTMFGGFGGAGTGQYLNETWIWNGNTQSWSQATPTATPLARVGHCMDSGPSYVIMFGGQISSGECKNDTWKWDGTNWTQLTPATSPSARTGASMTYDRTNNVWVMFGGMNEYYRLPETWTFNGTTWTQATPATSPSGLIWSQMCWDTQTGKILLFGGLSATDNYASAQTWSWSGTNWTLL